MPTDCRSFVIKDEGGAEVVYVTFTDPRDQSELNGGFGNGEITTVA